MKRILFAGGDARTLTAVEYMKKQGFDPVCYAITHRRTPIAFPVDAVVLPYPALKKGRLNAPLISNPPELEELIRETGIDPKTVPALGGPIPQNPFSRYTDLSQSEPLKLRNAVTTAEGALALLIEHTERSLFGMKVLILGYGAIGKRLSRILQALGAQVSVGARKEKDRVDAQLQGYGVQDTASLSLRGFQALFNTVPARLITEDLLNQASPELCVFELASPPGRCDPDMVKARNLKWIPGPALPGKVAPVTAGEDLAKTLIHILSSQKRKGSGTNLGT